MSTKLHRNVPSVVLFQIPSNYDPRVQNGPTPGAYQFSIGKSLKNLLIINYWANFNQILQECSLGGPLADFFKK